MILDIHDRAALQAAIRDHDCISFDIFDTLIMRKTLTPEDVFGLVADKLAARQHPLADSFIERRNRAILENVIPNPNLSQIYDQFARDAGLSVEEVRPLMELELQTEREVLVPRNAMVALYREALALGKTVCLITDMYLPGSVLEPLLQGMGITGYARLMVSCDCRTLKSETLFSLYKEAFPSTSYLHIGDNPRSDIACADANGLDCVQIPSALTLLRESRLRAVEADAATLAQRTVLGHFLARYCNDPFAGPAPAEVSWSQAALLVLPGVVYSFLSGLLDCVAENGYDRVLFAARDGFLLQKLYNELKPTDAAPGVYFYTSRRAVANVDLTDDHSLLWLANLPYAYPKNELLQKVFLLPDAVYDPSRSLDENVLAYREPILQRSRALGDAYRRYAAGLDLAGHRLLFVDLVSSGTCQMYLEQILSLPLEGYYLCKVKTEEAGKEALHCHALYPNDTLGQIPYAFYTIYHLFEYVLTSDEPSLLCFSEEGTPVFAPETRTPEELRLLCALQQTLAEEVRSLFGLCGRCDAGCAAFADRLIAAFLADENAITRHSFTLTDDWMGQRVTD